MSAAKDYAKAHLRGIWCAALMPFEPGSLALDEAGFAANLRHWFTDLGIDGVFVSGKQGEFFSMSLAERKRSFEIAAEIARATAKRTVMSASDQNIDTVIELARHAEAVGGDFIVVHAPVLHFVHDRDALLLEYYRHIAAQVKIGICMWSHPDSGYLMSPALCARIAEIPNIVGIKYSVPREMYVELTHLTRGKLIVSTAAEEEWLDNILELDWQVYLCSSPPYLLQSALDRRMRAYTDAAFAGRAAEARAISASLAPVRQALKSTRPASKPQSHQKYWQELLGQVGGAARRPMLELTEAEKAATRAAFAACGLRLPGAQAA
ncbi:dihydrodipicolinate synthase family protein [Rhodovarius sp.]|uniref:dihydrodipicolinate synthase family protein n=1 Tax=Rhodovarius sp. TaxID=2972673 RepID=UPI0033413D55